MAIITYDSAFPATLNRGYVEETNVSSCPAAFDKRILIVKPKPAPISLIKIRQEQELSRERELLRKGQEHRRLTWQFYNEQRKQEERYWRDLLQSVRLFSLRKYQRNIRQVKERSFIKNYYSPLKISDDFDIDYAWDVDLSYSLKDSSKKQTQKMSFDGPWYQPTGVIIIDGNAEKKSRRCRMTLSKLQGLDRICSEFGTLVFKHHIEHCRAKICLYQQKFVQVVSDYAKGDKIEPQISDLFGIGAISESIESAKSSISGTIEKISASFKNVIEDKNKLATLLWGLFKNIVTMLLNPNTPTIITSVSFSIADILSYTTCGTGNLLTLISEKVSALLGLGVGSTPSQKKDETANERQQSCGSEAEPQAATTTWVSCVSNLASVISMGIATVFGLRQCDANVSSYISKLMSISKNVIAVGGLVKLLLDSILNIIMVCWEWCLNKISQNSNYLSVVKNESDTMKSWVADVLSITDSAIREKVLSDPSQTEEIFRLYLMGQYFVNSIGLSNEKHSSISIVKEMHSKMQLMYNEVVQKRSTSPIKYEPLVIWLYGEPGIGKSHIVHQLAYLLNETFKMCPDENVIYTRNPGVPYWNNLHNEPIVFYDDYMAINDPQSTAPAELFLLKTCAAFNPPIADVAYKNRFYNPQVVIMTSNEAFPRTTAILNPEAFWRRRDILIKASFVSKYAGKKLNDVLPDDLSNIAHLEFVTHDDPADASSASSVSSPMSYNELKSFLVDSFRTYNTRAFKNYMEQVALSEKNVLSNAKNAKSLIVDLKAFFSQCKNVASTSLSSKLYETISQNNCFVPQGDVQSTDGTPVPDSASQQVAGAMSLPITSTSDSSASTTTPSSSSILSLPKFSLPSLSNLSLSIPISKQDSTIKECPCKAMLTNNQPYSYVFFDEEALSISELTCKSKYTSDQIAALKLKDGFYLNMCCDKYNEVFEIVSVAKLDELSKLNLKQGNLINEGDCGPTCCVSSDTKSGIYLKRSKIFEGVPSEQLPRNLRSQQLSPQELKDMTKSFAYKHFSHRIDCDIKRMDYTKVPSLLATPVYVPTAKFEKHKAYYYAYGVFLTVKEFLKYMSLILIPVAIYQGYRWYTSKSLKQEEEGGDALIEDVLSESLEPNLHSSGDQRTVKIARSNRVRADKLVANSEDDQIQVLCRKVVRNSFNIVVSDDSGIVLCNARCLGLYDQTAVIVTHYLEKFEDIRKRIPGAKFEIVLNLANAQSSHMINFKDLHVVPIKNRGYDILRIPMGLPAFKNLSSHFLANPETRFSSNCVLLETNNKSINFHSLTASLTNEIKVSATDYSKAWTISKGVGYSYGGRGVCGSVLITKTQVPKILGIHTAGYCSSNYGISEFIPFSQVQSIVDDRVLPQMESIDEAKVQLESNLVLLGSTKSPVRVSEKSKIERSVILQNEESFSVPAILSRKDPRYIHLDSPLVAGVEKHGKYIKLFEKEKVIRCVKNYQQKLDCYVKPVKPLQDLTYLEATNRNDLIEGYDRIELSTSEGYPYVLSRPKYAKDKSYLFEVDTEDKIIGISEDVLNVMDEKKELRDRKIIPCTIFSDCLKDTRVSKEKVLDLGKTRIFSIQPVDFTIQCRQYFLDYLVAYRKVRMLVESTIGINVNSLEWTLLFKKLVSFSPYIVAGDYSSFGDILDPLILSLNYDGIISWYKRYNSQTKFSVARKIASIEMINSLHLVVDLFYLTLMGQPSGCGNTVDMNSHVNSVMIRLAYFDLVSPNLSQFDSHVCLFTNGDDLVMAVKPQIIQSFNNLTLSKFFLKFNIRYTSPEKGEFSSPYQTIWEASYLKCNFVSHDFKSDIILAQLDWKSVHDCSLWIHSDPNKILASKETSLAVPWLLYGHGEDKYEWFISKLRKAWSELGIYLPFPSWRDLDDQFERDNYVEPQGDDELGAHGTGNVNVDKSETTAMEDERAKSIGTTSAQKAGNYIQYAIGGCASRGRQTCFEELTGRWLAFGNDNWSTSSPSGTTIANYHLPYDAVKKNITSTNFLAFRVHRFWRGDMTIKIVLNSNKFQIGQLQASWYYCDREDGRFGNRSNIFSASQLPHVLLNAGSSNIAELHIPYNHYLTHLYTSYSESDYVSNPLELGALNVRVLNVLKTTSSTENSCNISMYIKFSDCCFNGLIDSSLGLQSVSEELEEIMPNMDLLDVGLKAVNTLLDCNRDNPIQESPPNYIVPTAAHSFSVVSRQAEVLQTMRMQGSAQTPHPIRSNLNDMSISSVMRTFGLVKTLEWKTSHKVGSLLMDLPAMPIMDMSEYNSKVIQSTSCRYLPPVSVVTSMFCYWRGDLEFRFDVVSSAFHTGRLHIAYVPGIQDKNKITYQKSMSSYYEVYDFQSPRSIVFRVPYMAPRPWWPNRYSAAEKSSINLVPGRVVMFVANPLIINDSIPNEVEINLYIRAAENYEVSILGGATMGLSFNAMRKLKPTEDYTYPFAGYYPMYTTWSHLLDRVHLTLYHATTSGAITQWEHLVTDQIYSVPQEINAPNSTTPWRYRIPFYDNNNRVQSVRFLVKVKQASYPVVYCFITSSSARSYIATGDPAYAVKWRKDGGWDEYYDDKGWHPMTEALKPKFPKLNAEDLQNLLEAQGDEKTSIDSPIVELTIPVSSTNFGADTFGERINDLKDICRRYCRYSELVVLGSISMPVGYTVSFPVLPQRLSLSLNKWGSSDNALRDGLIPTVASGFRFSRGGIRFRIIFYGLDSSSGVLIQFRPDALTTGDSIVVLKSNAITRGNQMLDVGYPTVYQGMIVNNVVEFEVPWYLTGEYNLLQPVKLPKDNKNKNQIISEFASLGSLYLYFYLSKNKDNVKFQIFYSLADDCSFSTFVGFPPIFPLFET